MGEDKKKVEKISSGSFKELRNLYANQLSKMNEFIYAPKSGSEDMSKKVTYEQDMSPGARHFHLTMLPKNMQEGLVTVSMTLISLFIFSFIFSIALESRWQVERCGRCSTISSLS